MTDTSMTLSEPLRSTDGYDAIGMSQREIRLAMLANGYEPLPLIGKAPIPKKWEQIIINEQTIHGWANAGPNTGMRAATAPGLDIDILDEQAAQIVEATDAAVFGRQRRDTRPYRPATEARYFAGY